jgi:regulator of protease activity HflC (stomatin/prohibitin superfamily)
VFTKDEVNLEADALVVYQVIDPVLATVNLENAKTSTKLLAQSTLRNVLATKSLAEIRVGREQTASEIRKAMNKATWEFGIKVDRVDLREIRFPNRHSNVESNHSTIAKLMPNPNETLNGVPVFTYIPAAVQLQCLPPAAAR